MDILFKVLIYVLVWFKEFSAEPPMLTVYPNGLKVYDIANMHNFNVKDYLNEYAPHLSEHATDLEYWSKYARIDPRILICLMEYQSGIVLRPSFTIENRETPFGNMSNAYGFEAQLSSVAEVLKYRQSGHMVPRWFAVMSSSTKANPFVFLNPLQPTDLKNKQRYDDLRFLFTDMFYLEFDTMFSYRTKRWWERLMIKDYLNKPSDSE